MLLPYLVLSACLYLVVGVVVKRLLILQVIVMDHAGGGDDDDAFIYMGGDQRVPDDVTHVRIHKSVKIISQHAFHNCRNLVSIEMHNGVEIIEEYAFTGCESLCGINLTGVRIIGKWAFDYCKSLTDVIFGDKLEIIVSYAFYDCKQLTDVEFSENLERIWEWAFVNCLRLRRIAIPLKDNLLGNGVFDHCDDLSQVYLVGGVHKTVSSLLLDSWRNEMKGEINQINQDLPNIPTDEKTSVIRRWMGVILQRVEHFKREHYALLKDAMTLLELALWKANHPSIDAAAISRRETRVTCGANIIIPHVLSFLNDDDVFPLLNQSAE